MRNITEFWYEIQYSTRGEDDWYSANTSADTIEGARRKLAEFKPSPTMEFRIVNVTRTEEVVV